LSCNYPGSAATEKRQIIFRQMRICLWHDTTDFTDFTDEIKERIHITPLSVLSV